MSKFPSILLPAIGVTGLALGLAFALPTRHYKAEEAEVARRQAAAAEARAADALALSAATTAEMEQLAAAMMAAPVGSGDPAPSGAPLGLGREATATEVAAWDIDVRPDGTGLPEGSGDVWTGEEVFVEKCAVCHGDFGEAVGRWPVLAGGQGTLTRADPVKTIGSYWPYLSTVFDYVNRAMPFGEAQSLTPDEVYAITAYLLYLNNLAEDDFELSHENFTEVRLPNEDNFFPDDRAETELASFSVEPCMTGCKESVEITMRATVLDVTPQDDTQATADDPVEVASNDVETMPETEAPDEAQPASADAALIAAGEAAFRQCSSCHQVGATARNAAGPQLNGVIGRAIGSVDGFRYSNTLADAHDAGEVWTADRLSAFLADPRGTMPGTKMAFRGVGDAAEIEAILAYLGSIEAD